MTGHRGRRAIALVSGGLDSIVSLAKATEDMAVRLVLFFNYGQRALERERHAVMGAVDFYGLPFREVDISVRIVNGQEIDMANTFRWLLGAATTDACLRFGGGVPSA